MIRTVFTIAVLRMCNNKHELALALLVPAMFFSIFALIFGRGVASGTPAIKIAAVDDDASQLSRDLLLRLNEESAVDLDRRISHTNERWPLERLTSAILRESNIDVVIHFPPDMEERLLAQTAVEIGLFIEGTNPVGRQLVQSTLLPVLAELVAKRNRELVAVPTRQNATDVRQLSATRGPPKLARPTASPLDELVTIETADVFADTKHNPKIAMYAAGIAVMFLLFSATGAGGSLLEEHEAGTLDRLLTSRLGLTDLLIGKWLFITLLGCVQLSVMFLWAQVAFGVDLFGHLEGFAVMTICTAAATASLALCLATFCRTRAALNGISVVLILTMSALGGSMIPRYIMSDEMRRWGQLTFNAWAYDGFQKVFWYDLPVAALETEVKVLLSMAVALASIARLGADRWSAN